MGLPLFDKRGVVRIALFSNQEESQKFVDGSVAEFNLGLFGNKEIELFLRMWLFSK